VTLALNRAVVHVHHLALLAVHQVVFINVFGHRLLPCRLRTATLAHGGRAARPLRVLGAGDVAAPNGAPSRCPDGRGLAGDLFDGAIQIAAGLHYGVLNAFGGDRAARRRLLPDALLDAVELLAAAEVVADLLLDNDSILRQLTQLLLCIRVSDRVVVRLRLPYLLYLPRVVFYVFQYLVRVLRF